MGSTMVDAGYPRAALMKLRVTSNMRVVISLIENVTVDWKFIRR